MKVYKSKLLFYSLRRIVFSNTILTALGLLLVGGCATTSNNNDLVIADAAAEIETPAPAPARKEPPNMALDAELLEQLMISNFASYAGDWSSAVSSALSAAQISQDYRLARLASVLALRSRSYTEVAVASELWHRLDADSSDAYNALLIGLVGAGEVDAAIEKFDQRFTEIELGRDISADEQTNSAIDTHIRQVAGLLVRQPNSESAMQIVQEYVRREPRSAQVLLSSSYVANFFEQDDLAQQWLNQALQVRPDWDVAAQMYSNMLARQDKGAERLAYIRLFIKDNPRSVPMRIQYAAELARMEDYQASLELMQAVMVDDPQNSEAIIYAAALAQQQEQTELTEQLYQRALEIEPDNERVLWALAALAIEQEEFREAERYYQRIGRGESYFRSRLQIANMRYEISGLDSAINYLRFIEPRTEGDYVEIALARHYLLLQEYKYEDAFGYINDSLVYLPDNVDMLYARALVAAEINEIAIAESDLRAIIARYPEHANALNALGYTLADQTDRYEEARDLIAQALEIEPDQGHILDSMGWVLYRLEDYAGAITYLLKAFEVMPEAEVATHLGEVYWESGQQQLARDIWLRAYELDASNELLLKTIERYGQQELYASQQVIKD